MNSPLILLDGAITVTEDREIIDLNLLDLEIGKEVVEIGKRFGIHPFDN